MPLSSAAMGIARDQRLAAQDAVLVGKGESDGLELLLLDDGGEPLHRVLFSADHSP